MCLLLCFDNLLPCKARHTVSISSIATGSRTTFVRTTEEPPAEDRVIPPYRYQEKLPKNTKSGRSQCGIDSVGDSHGGHRVSESANKCRNKRGASPHQRRNESRLSAGDRVNTVSLRRQPSVMREYTASQCHAVTHRQAANSLATVSRRKPQHCRHRQLQSGHGRQLPHGQNTLVASTRNAHGQSSNKPAAPPLQDVAAVLLPYTKGTQTAVVR